MRISSIWVIIILITASFSLSAQNEEERFEFSPEKSYVKWIAIDGETEVVGSFKLKSGQITMSGEEMKLMTVFVDMKSLECHKCGNDQDKKKLLEFMKSPAFLNTEVMDYSSFKMYENKKLEKGTYQLKGLMSMIGYSHEVSFPASIQIKKGKLTGEAEFSVNRDLWNLRDPNDGRLSHPSSTIKLQIHLESQDKE